MEELIQVRIERQAEAYRLSLIQAPQDKHRSQKKRKVVASSLISIFSARMSRITALHVLHLPLFLP